MSERPAFPVAARALLRDTVLDTVGELIANQRWAQVTMAQVAKGAGVSRQTLYNEFGDRDGLAQAYVLREGARFLTDAQAAIAANEGDPRRALQAAFGGFLAAAGEHPVIRAFTQGEGGGDELLALVTTRGAPVLSLASAGIAHTLVAGWPRLDPDDARSVAETVVRLAISHAALPTEPPARSARAMAAVLGPFFEEARGRGRGSAAA